MSTLKLNNRLLQDMLGTIYPQGMKLCPIELGWHNTHQSLCWTGQLYH